LPVFCNVEVHLPLRNVVDVRLSMLDILPEYTQSKIRNQREITLETLKKEGILDNQKKIIVPPLISRIGLITSEQGTSIKDIRAGLHPFIHKYSIFFVDSRMEGTHAVDSIIDALTYLEQEPTLGLDLVIIARGGGSEQSLSVFNDLRLCRKICHSPLPIITAIGHEKDISAIESCSWFTPIPATPSGVGKYLHDRYRHLQEQLSTSLTQLVHRFSAIHQQEMEKLRAFLKNIPTRILNSFKYREQSFINRTKHLEQSVSFTVKDQERRIADLNRQFLEKSRTLQQKNQSFIRDLSSILLSRVHLLEQREYKQMEKILAKIDFNKRLRESLRRQDDLNKKARYLYSLAQKNFKLAHKDLSHQEQLIQARDPRQILKKGFTLTTDSTGKIIKTLKEFARQRKARLTFFDGSTDIIASTISQNPEEANEQTNPIP